MGGPVEMFENLSRKVPGYRRAERAGGGVANEVKVPDLLCDDAQTWTKNGKPVPVGRGSGGEPYP
jgi:hypothetical protein